MAGAGESGAVTGMSPKARRQEVATLAYHEEARLTREWSPGPIERSVAMRVMVTRSVMYGYGTECLVARLLDVYAPARVPDKPLELGERRPGVDPQTRRV